MKTSCSSSPVVRTPWTGCWLAAGTSSQRGAGGLVGLCPGGQTRPGLREQKALWSLEGVPGRCSMKLNLAARINPQYCRYVDFSRERGCSDITEPPPPQFALIPDQYTLAGQVSFLAAIRRLQQGPCLRWRHRLRLEPSGCPRGSSPVAVAHVTCSLTAPQGLNTLVLRRQCGKTRVIWRGALPCQVLKY